MYPFKLFKLINVPSIRSVTAVRILSKRSKYLTKPLVGACFGVLPAFCMAQGIPVNVNTATAEQLAESLNGVGVAKAYRIVEYREAHGPFEVVDELGEVKGIGAAIVDKNRDLIVLQ